MCGERYGILLQRKTPQTRYNVALLCRLHIVRRWDCAGHRRLARYFQSLGVDDSVTDDFGRTCYDVFDLGGVASAA